MQISSKRWVLCIRLFQVYRAIMMDLCRNFYVKGLQWTVGYQNAMIAMEFRSQSSMIRLTTLHLILMLSGWFGRRKFSQSVSKNKKNVERCRISLLSSQFLKHSYIKREQSDMFNMHDIPRAKNVEFGDEGALQFDFAENFVCEFQDEVQSAHWNQLQLTLFTIGAIAKTIVRRHINARDCIVNSASVTAFSLTSSKISVQEVTNEEITQINTALDTTIIFTTAKDVRDISSAHHMQIIDGKVITFQTSKEGYN